MNTEEPSPHPMPPVDEDRFEDASLVERLRQGDAEAGYVFFRGHYPGVHRYLLWLTGRPELAEDLAQETFLRAWRYLDTFDLRGSLRVWLHGIARREFMRARRRDPTPASLEELGDVAAPGPSVEIASLELREALRKLPEEQREAIILHYLEGYSSVEIARIVGAPEGTIRYRLSQARERLRRELGEGDLAYLNEPLAPMRQWHWLPLDQMHTLQTRVSLESEASKEEAMERREFLRQAAAGAAGLMLPDAEKEVVDGRLAQKVTLAFKGTALTDLCEHLRSETGMQIAAGASVADEKVTLFCEKTPVREVMRQLSRPFGYAWTRSTRNGAYRYELTQDLRSQLLEEELRNRDRHAALLALERDIDRYRPYLDLSPDEALARARSAAPADRPLLEKLAGCGRGPIHTYFRLSPALLAALRAGKRLTFSEEPRPGQELLPREIARGVLQSRRVWRAIKRDDGWQFTQDATDPRSVPLTSVPEMRAFHELAIEQSDLGQFTLNGDSGFFISGRIGGIQNGEAPYAAGRSSAALQPQNSVFHARLASDPALRRRVTVRLELSSGAPRSADAADRTAGARVTSADVLEALHRATGLPVVGDYYTRLVETRAIEVSNQLLFDALNTLADALRSRWNRDSEGGWLQFRSTSYYDDRLKEVPNRLLFRWVAARRQHGTLTIDDLVEIAQLSDAQLDAEEMAEGARECYGLEEWDLARNYMVRPHLRYLAGFTPEQRQQAMSPTGLPFTQMSLAQQQAFIANALSPGAEPLQFLEELRGAALRVDYTQPGWFQWLPPGPVWLQWVIPTQEGPAGARKPVAPVRARTRAAALRAALRIEPQVAEMMLQIARRDDPRIDAAQMAPQEPQVVPTQLDLRFIYIPGVSNRRPIHLLKPYDTEYHGTGG